MEQLSSTLREKPEEDPSVNSRKSQNEEKDEESDTMKNEMSTMKNEMNSS